MRWYRHRALSGCAVCGGLAGDVVSVAAVRQQLLNRGHAVRSQYELYTQGRGSEGAVTDALDSLNEALVSARETMQLGRGTATVDQWADLQDTYRRSEYTYTATVRALEEGEAEPGPAVVGGGGGGGGGAVVPTPGTGGGKPMPTGAGAPGGFSLATITDHPAFWPALIGIGAVGISLWASAPQSKPKPKRK